MVAKKHHDLHFHHPDHVLIALAFIIVVAVFIGYMMGKSVTAPMVSGPLPTPTVAAMQYEDEGTMCDADAMVCPDGTTVGRSGPYCEFVCP